MKEPMLPENIEAEMGVLGYLLIADDDLSDASDMLDPTHFYRDSHRIIYGAMRELSEQGIPIDVITVCDLLERQKKLAAVGGLDYLNKLISNSPDPGMTRTYARIILQSAIRRRLMEAAGKIAALAHQEEDAMMALEQAEKLILEINQERAHTDFQSDRVLVNAYMHQLMERQASSRHLTGVPTGLSDLDDLLGGLRRKDLIILAARPSVGKSALALSFGHYLIRHEHMTIALFSLEMGNEQVIARLISIDSGVNLFEMGNGKIRDDDWGKLTASMEAFSEERLWVDETAGLSLPTLRRRLRRLHSRHPVGLLIIDYLQLMSGTGGKNVNRVQEIDEITKGLKGIAKEFDIPVLALAQLSRAVEARQDKTPMLSDLRESGSIENDADVIMFLYRDIVYNPKTERPNEADIIVAKHRNGPTDEVPIFFKKETTHFCNLEKGNRDE